MRFIRNNHTDPYFNMAFDEYCLEHLELDEPVFYLWRNRPSVILGYNQEVNTEVNLDFLRQNDICLVRRVTGGGAVYHDLGNLNYTIVGRSEDLERDYPEYASYVQRALCRMGVSATISGRNDILVEGRKVSGFAKRVCRDRLMVHGTLMYRVDVDVLEQVLTPSAGKLKTKGVASVRSRVANLCDYLSDVDGVEDFAYKLEEIMANGYADSEYVLGGEQLECIRRQAQEKFMQEEWIYGRSPRATLSERVRLACGTVEVHLIIGENRIVSCRFSGDFIGNLPASDVETALVGVEYRYQSVSEKLETLRVEDYFDRVSASELASVLMG